MHNQSLPPGDREETASNIVPAQAVALRKQFTPAVLSSVNDFMKEHAITVTGLAKLTGLSITAVSKYVHGKPEGNVEKQESLLSDCIKAYIRRKDVKIVHFETSVSEDVEGALETIRQAKRMGGIFGPAGIGKTCGIALYCAKNTSAISICATEWQGSNAHMRHALWEAVDTSGWYRSKEKLGRMDWLVEKFTGSRRLIIVDEAHELKKSGRKFWRHFHDQTHCPIAYVGNREFLAKVKADAQHDTRLMYVKDNLSPDTGRIFANSIIEQFAPGAWEEIGDLALIIIKREDCGYGRALANILSLANVFVEKQNCKLRDAFRSAALHQPHPITLPK